MISLSPSALDDWNKHRTIDGRLRGGDFCLLPSWAKRGFLWDHRKVDALRGDEEHQKADVDINAIVESVGEWGKSAGTVADSDETALLRKGRVCLELTARR